ncbi:MAG: subclass B1 metallo-beta-lactamase [Bacteroidales bacterium]|nr:subclass B1 metallo-beta-lactamase [Bacteroidales bacterium]
MRIILIITLYYAGIGLWAKPSKPAYTISENLELYQISANAYLHISYTNSEQFGRFSSNGMVYVVKGEGVLIDTPTDTLQTRELLDFLQDSLHISITGFIGTHWHNDCIGGLQTIHQQGIESYACELTQNIAENKGLPVPKIGFKDSLTIFLQGQPIKCMYPGAGHTLDNIIVWLPESRILFGGCLIKCLSAQGLGNIIDADITAWPETLKKIERIYPDAQIIIPGHGSWGGIELVEHTLSLFTP